MHGPVAWRATPCGNMHGMSPPSPDLSLLRRACAPCSLRQFCQSEGSEFIAEGGPVGKVQALPRGSSLFRVGDAQGVVYIVRAGALKTVAVTEDGEEHVLGFHLPGEMVGLDALATGTHCVEAVALIESNVCAVPMQTLVQRSHAAPELGRELLQVIGRTAMRCHGHVDVLMRRQAGERIAMFLYELLQRTSPGGDGRDLHLPMSREDVARYLGLALETVSRGFTRLQDEGVINVSGRAVRVLDVAALRRLALLPEADVPRETSLQRQA